MLKKSWVLILFSVFLWSCGADKDVEQPVSKEEAMSFASKIENSLKKGNHSVFDSIFNEKVFAQRITEQAGARSDKNFLKGAMEGLKNVHLGQEILGSMKDGGSYELVRNYQKDGKQHLIFRLYGSSGINYHDLELVKMKDRVAAADMFIYLTGEPFSKTIATLMGTFLNYADKKNEQAAMHYTTYLRDMKSLMMQQKYQDAKDTYNKLPEEFKSGRLFKLMNIQISSQLGDEEYRSALQDYESKFGTDQTAQLALIDGYFIKKEFEKMLGAINKVDEAVHDPLLNYYRAIAYTQMKDVPNTIKYLEVLKKEKPDFGDGILELIANYVETGSYDKASQLVKEYKANSNFDQEKINNIRWLYPNAADKIGL